MLVETTERTFGIKPGYQTNPGPVYFTDDVEQTRGVLFQPDVYSFAEWVARMSGCRSIIDIGCGRANKLALIHERHPSWDFIGVDHGSNIEYCQKTYEWGEWLEKDLEKPFFMEAEGSVVICSDVIEHLVDPHPLLVNLYTFKAAAIVLSTPERDVQHGYDHMGPSPNVCHVREWNASEFKDLLESEGLTVDHLGLTRGSDQGWAMGTILAVCH